MTLLEHIRERRITKGEVADVIGIAPWTLRQHEATGDYLDLSVRQAVRLCDFVGISKQEFMKGNIKPLKGSRR